MENILKPIVYIAAVIAGTGDAVFAQLPDYVPASGLIAYYGFNGNANDLSGNGNTGTVSGPIYITDRYGNPSAALQYAGVNERVTTHKIDRTTTNTFSYSVWVAPTDSAVIPVQNSNVLIAGTNFTSACVIDPVDGWNWSPPAPATHVGAGLYVGTNGIYVLEHGPDVITAQLSWRGTLTGWHNIVIVYVSGLPQLFVDGCFVQNGAISGRVVHPSVACDSYYVSSIYPYVNAGFGHGINPFFPTPQPTINFTGDIDDIAIYNRALTPCEITRLYDTIPPTTSITGITTLCVGATTTLSVASSGGTWSGSNTGIATVGSGTGIVTGVSGGTSTISYILCSGCFDTTTVTVEPQPYIGPITGLPDVCVGGTASVADSTLGGVWASGNTAVATVTAGGTVTGVAAGTDTIQYTVTGAYCNAMTTEVITVNPAMSAGSITGTSLVCIGETITLSDSVGSGSWSSSNTGVASVSVGIVSGVSTGTATISYSVTNTCGTVVAPYNITVNLLPVTGIITGSPNVCIGSPTTLTDAASSGVWSSSNTGLATVSGGVVSGVTTGTVTISYTVASASCGTASATKGITVYAQPSAGVITGLSTVCTGATILLTDPSSSGVWSSSNTSICTVGAGVVSGAAAGTAIISYSVTNICGTALASYTFSVNQTPHTGTITGSNSVCIGATITLTDTSSGGAWSSNNSTIATVTGGMVTGISGGTAIISYSVASAFCGSSVAIKEITIYAPPSAGAIMGLSTVCVAGGIALTDPVIGGVWSSSTGIATVSGGGVTGISAGTATISYTVTNICNTAVALHNVTVNPTPNAGTITGPSTVCADLTITLVDLATSGTWSSSNTSVATVSGGVIRGISAGTATITYSVESVLCGTATEPKTITVNPLPKAGIITGDSDVCFGIIITLADTITGGVWSSSNTSVCTVAAGIVTEVSVGTATISYIVISASCGTAIAIKPATINPLPFSGTITGDSEICIGTPITLADTVTGGVWGSNNTGIATISSGVVTGITPGIDTIRYTVTSASCGNAAAIRTITVNPLAIADVITGDSEVCIGTVIKLSDTVTGGAWGASNTSITTVFGGSVTGLALGTDTIEYIVTNMCGHDTASKLITVNPLPDAGTITGDNLICKSTDFALSETDTGGLWSSSNAAIATIGSNTGAVYGLALGTTTITYTTAPDANGCVNTTVFPLTIGAGFTIRANVAQITCYGINNGSIITAINEGTGAYQYIWSRGDSTSAIDSLAPGTYTVNVRDTLTQCAAADSFIIVQPDSMAISADITNDTCKSGMGSIYARVTGGTAPYQYLWSNNATGSSLTGLIANTYVLTVTDINNCKKEDALIVADTCTGIIIHDAITPNGDGINDVWVIEGMADYPKNTVQIFDKWGNLLYEKSGYQNDWGGRGSYGELLPDGTYFYLVKLNAENIYGGKNVFTGALLVKR